MGSGPEVRCGPVRVVAPATSANLGPGFDCLGIALDLHDTLVAEVRPSGLEVTVEGEGAEALPTDERHLVVRAIRMAFDAVGVPNPGLRLHCVNRIPQGRGLGSSSAAIVGGLALASALVPGPGLEDQQRLVLANALEGHPDNVAPAILGGLVVSGQGGAEVWAVPAQIAPELSVSIFVPPTGLSTERARALLPGSVPHADAVANTGRAALLVTALATGRREHLMRASEDFLHQDYREVAMPESLALVHRLRGQRIPATISGAGPSVLAWHLGADTGADAGSGDGAATPIADTPSGWKQLVLAVDRYGARVLPA